MAEASTQSGGPRGTLADVVRRLRLRLEADGRAGLAAVPRPVQGGSALEPAAEAAGDVPPPGEARAAARPSPGAPAPGSKDVASQARAADERTGDSTVAARNARAAEAVETVKEQFAASTAGAEGARPAPAVGVKGPGLFDQLSPDLEDGSSPEEALRRITDEVAECRRCPELADSRTHTVPGQGSPYADLLFIGEGPGADEDAQGVAFIGRAGQLLTKMIEGIGMTREQVFIANILKCRPPGNRKPTPEEEANCVPYLARQIEIIRPKVIVALGGTAAQYLLQTHDGITRLRGRFYPYMGARLMPTFHPAYVLRNYTKDTRQKVYDDLLAAKAAAAEA